MDPMTPLFDELTTWSGWVDASVSAPSHPDIYQQMCQEFGDVRDWAPSTLDSIRPLEGTAAQYEQQRPVPVHYVEQRNWFAA